MQFIRRYRWAIIGVGSLAVLLAFLAFRPDKLFIDDVVDESLSDAFATSEESQETPVTTTTQADAAPDATSQVTQPPSSTTTQPSGQAQPTVVTSGIFEGVGSYRAMGGATVYEQDGTFVLRFEDDTDIQNGPDLFIWLLPTDEYNGGSPTEYIDLGLIKGNVGGQNYELPPEFDPDVDQLVLVWCKRFSVPFAAASLS